MGISSDLKTIFLDTIQVTKFTKFASKIISGYLGWI